jgi:hypothetical protein
MQAGSRRGTRVFPGLPKGTACISYAQLLLLTGQLT